MNHQTLSSFIWSIAEYLRGDYRQSEYGRVILPFTVLRRLDCVLAPTKEKVLKEVEVKGKSGVAPEPFLLRASGQNFYNTSPFDMKKLMGDQDHIRENLYHYVSGFSPAVRDIFDRFEFQVQIERLSKNGLLYQVAERFAQVYLHPDKVSNFQMGLAFEELIRKFAELSNETAGEHFTPREVIRLMVNLIFIEDDDALSKPGVVRTIYDPTAGTGGMLSIAGEYLEEHNPKSRLTAYGQELNPESFAICKADMLIKGQDVNNIAFGNTLSDDGHAEKHFDYMLSNPPFGVEWKKVEKEVRREHEAMGFEGRFGPGLPRVSDGSMLFLMHLVKKMRPAAEGGGRFGIVLNGSPLFTGAAGSGESEIRRYVLENDLVEAIIGLPTDMFYNTGIITYIWVVSNKKPAHRKGLVQLIDASGMWQKMRKSLGSKRKELSDDHIAEITRLFGRFETAERDGKPISRIFKNTDFGYRTITVERPERDANGKIVMGQKGKMKGKPMPDSKLRDTENVPLSEDIEEYFKREVLPHAPDAWIDHDKTKVGYEIPFNRHFYVFTPPRPLAEIDADLKRTTDRIKEMIEGASGQQPSNYPKHKGTSAESLPAIPSHWDALFMKRFARLMYGDALPVDVRDEGGGIPVYGSNGVVGSHSLANTKSPVILVGRKGSCGALNWANSPSFAIDTAYFIDNDCCCVDLKWLFWALHTANFGESSQDTGVPGLSRGIAHSTTFPVPPAAEQSAIADFIDREAGKIDELLAEQQRLAELLKEKRSALISAAVTGKIDVRGLVEPTPDNAPEKP